MSLACPADERECRQLLTTAYEQDHPVVVRYPAGGGAGVHRWRTLDGLPFGKGEVRRQGRRIAILAFGTLLYPALQAAELDATVVNMRWAKPLDTELLLQVAAEHEALVTVEEGCIMGGAGSAVAEALNAAGVQRPLLQLGLPDDLHRAWRPGEAAGAAGAGCPGIEHAIAERFLARRCLHRAPWSERAQAGFVRRLFAIGGNRPGEPLRVAIINCTRTALMACQRCCRLQELCLVINQLEILLMDRRSLIKPPASPACWPLVCGRLRCTRKPPCAGAWRPASQVAGHHLRLRREDVLRRPSRRCRAASSRSRCTPRAN